MQMLILVLPIVAALPDLLAVLFASPFTAATEEQRQTRRRIKTATFWFLVVGLLLSVILLAAFGNDIAYMPISGFVALVIVSLSGIISNRQYRAAEKSKVPSREM